MDKKYDIESSFNDFYQNCKQNHLPGVKIVAFPTGMGKTHGAANNAIKVAQNGDLPIFIAPRIAILKDFEQTAKKAKNDFEIIRIISDTELKQVDYFSTNYRHFQTVYQRIDGELIDFIKKYKPSLPANIKALDVYFSQYDSKAQNDDGEVGKIYKLYSAAKSIKEIYQQFKAVRTSLHIEEVRNELNNKLWKIYTGILNIFEVTNYFHLKNGGNELYQDPQDKYKFLGFKCFDKKIVKDYFGLSFLISDIKKNKHNTNYAITVTSKKSLKYIGRTFEVCSKKMSTISGTESNQLFFNRFINTFCKNIGIQPVYYIDEADEFYNEIIEDKTNTIHLNNFLFKIKNFFDYSTISSFLSFLNKIEKNKNTAIFADELKALIFNFNNNLKAEKIEDLFKILQTNKADVNPLKIPDSKILGKIRNFISNDFSLSSLFKDIKEKEKILFIFVCFLDSLGMDSKIEQLDKSSKKKNAAFLDDFSLTINNSKDFLQSWYNEYNNATAITSKNLFIELNKINDLLNSSDLGETIIRNEDFIELAENNKFMFGNDSLSLVEEQIKYLNNLVSIEGFSDNALLEMQENIDKHSLTLSYIFSFLTKVLIRTVQKIRIPNYDQKKEDSTLDKEMSCHDYMRKMKTAFSNLKKIEDSQFKIKKDLLFDENYIYSVDKNVINLFTTNYDKNIKLGKPGESSYIQMSNIHIKNSPEVEIINFLSIIENKETKHFSCNAVVFLMSATSTIYSYYGNFDYEYLKKEFKEKVIFDATYLNEKDIEFLNIEKLKYIDKETSRLYKMDYGIYNTKQFNMYDDFSMHIKNSNNKNLEILRGEHNEYKLFEFQSFVYSIESLLRSDIQSLFFISQTTNHIMNFMNDYVSGLLNMSSPLISKFSVGNKNHDGIFLINKDIFNKLYKNHNLEKDIVIIFYDSKFENKQKSKINENVEITEDKDASNEDLDLLDAEYENLKKEIFNEDKYNILLCSSYGSIAKGFNFVTNKNGQEKDFDAINLGMDPFYDNLSQDKDEALVYQRIVAMKDFYYKNKRGANLNELMDYFYLNKTHLLQKEHLSSIARIIIQSLGRIERRRYKNNNDVQHIFINTETYKKMEKFYHFYEYNRYIDGDKKIERFCSNLSVNNAYVFEETKKEHANLPTINNYKVHKEDQINKNIILQELIEFLLLKVRRTNQTKKEFKDIWEILKSQDVLHNLSKYMSDLDNIVQPKLKILISKYAIKKDYPNLHNINNYKLSEIFFVCLEAGSKPGLSTVCHDGQNIDIVVDYANANKEEYEFFKLIFRLNIDDFSNEILNQIKWLKGVKDVNAFFTEKYTIQNKVYIPQRKIAIEFIKTAISEGILENILLNNNFTIKTQIDNDSYELFDFFIQHDDKQSFTAIDLKFWSITTQALNSKKIEEKFTKKTYVADLKSLKNIMCINLFGKQTSNYKNGIYYKNLLIKNEITSSPNYKKYVINPKLINLLKEEIKK